MMADLDQMEEIRFRVDGKAVTQGNHSIFRGRVVDATKGLKQWRAAATAAALAAVAGRPPLDGPLVLRLSFYLPRGSSVKRPLPTVKPDLDKLVRAMGDAITDAKAWKDDSLVVDIHTSKRYADDGVPHVDVFIYQYDWTLRGGGYGWDFREDPLDPEGEAAYVADHRDDGDRQEDRR